MKTVQTFIWYSPFLFFLILNLLIISNHLGVAEKLMTLIFTLIGINIIWYIFEIKHE